MQRHLCYQISILIIKFFLTIYIYFLNNQKIIIHSTVSSLFLQSVGPDQVRLTGLRRLRQRQRWDAPHGGLSGVSVLSHAVPAGRGGLRALPGVRRRGIQELGSSQTGHPELAAATLQEQHGRRGRRRVWRGLPDHRVGGGDVGTGEESCGWSPAVGTSLLSPRQDGVSAQHRLATPWEVLYF